MFRNLSVPGSKSYTNRALVLAGMCSKPTELSGFLFCEDSYWGIDALQKLGFWVETDIPNNKVRIIPPEVNFFSKNIYTEIYFGKSGTLARFFMSVILNWQKTFSCFNPAPLHVFATGDEQLIRRPLADLILALQKLGGNFSSTSLPLVISSSDLQGACQIPGEKSSQFLSGLLLAAIGAKNKIQILREGPLVQPDYVKMTIAAIRAFGGQVEHDASFRAFNIFQRQDLFVDKFEIEADASTSCYFISLAFLHNFNLRICNIGSRTLQPDLQFVQVLQQLGAQIEAQEKETFVYKRDQNTQEPFNKNLSFDFSQISDQALTLGVVALFASQPIEIRNIAHIRLHESDRISCFVKNILSLGLRAEEKEDGFIVYPINRNLAEIAGDWETWDDHRFTMSGFLLASLCPRVVLKNPECVKKTAPTFFSLVQELGFK